jgi:hypothetical protein
MDGRGNILGLHGSERAQHECLFHLAATVTKSEQYLTYSAMTLHYLRVPRCTVHAAADNPLMLLQYSAHALKIEPTCHGAVTSNLRVPHVYYYL